MTTTEIDQIKQQTNIVTTIQAYLPLKKKGPNFWGCCPFHGEKSPSFAVHEKDGFYKCFGCGASGDVINFIMQMERLEFQPAVEFLAKQSPTTLTTPVQTQQPVIQKRSYKTVDPEIVKATLKSYNQNNLFLFLVTLCDPHYVAEAFAKYHVGTTKSKGCVFWQRDRRLQFMTGQAIDYKLDGHRDKQKDPVRLFTMEQGYSNSIFGEHLLFSAKQSDLVCVVESEKSALICSIWMPAIGLRKCIWVASVGMNGMTDQKIEALKGFDVCLVPDFAFHARAVWGVVPMRKKSIKKMIRGEEKDVLVISKDGDVVADYVSLKDKLKRQGNKVFFLDPFPDLEDGTDIADYLLTIPAPKRIDVPDFSSLELTIEKKSINHFRTRIDRPVDFDWSPPQIFNLIETNSGMEIQGLKGYALSVFEDKMENATFKDLISRFGIIKGTVGPLIQ